MIILSLDSGGVRHSKSPEQTFLGNLLRRGRLNPACLFCGGRLFVKYFPANQAIKFPTTQFINQNVTRHEYAGTFNMPTSYR